MFFWFFGSRKDPCNAPLAIWLNGRPGASSTASGLGENGPCIVGEDSNSATLNPWSWNNEVNMLYIDQPVQVGFSYYTFANETFNALSTTLLPETADFSASRVPVQNESLFAGTFPSLTTNGTANSVRNAAPAVWNFLYTWFQEYAIPVLKSRSILITSRFPTYKPRRNTLPIWTESYGGHWAQEWRPSLRSKTINHGRHPQGHLYQPRYCPDHQQRGRFLDNGRFIP